MTVYDYQPSDNAVQNPFLSEFVKYHEACAYLDAFVAIVQFVRHPLVKVSYLASLTQNIVFMLNLKAAVNSAVD